VSASYIVRLVGLSFAAFFLVHVALSFLVLAIAARVLRAADGMPARAAERLLMALRLGPAAVAACTVVTLCIPSYLWFEPRGIAEEDVGLVCVVAAILGLGGWALSTTRAARAWLASARYTRACRRAGSIELLPGLRPLLAGDQAVAAPAVVVDQRGALVALCGIVRPALLVSRRVLASLDAEQLDATLRHEYAHRSARHNLKRLLFLVAPDALPFHRSFAAIEARWTRFAEWAADDEVATGNPARALALASALVRVAQLGREPELPLACSLTSGGRDLEARVTRLLEVTPYPEAAAHVAAERSFALAAALTAVALSALLLVPVLLPPVHRLLEQLIR